MKTLKRRHARLCRALLALMPAFGLLPLAAYRVLQLDGMLWAYLGSGGLIACLALSLAVQSCCLRCPSRGRGLASPQWRAGERCRCAKCGQPFVFDDEERPR